MRQKDKEVLRSSLQHIMGLLEPEPYTDPYSVRYLQGEVFCDVIPSDDQMHLGRNLLTDSMSPSSANMANFVDALFRRAIYLLLDRDIWTRQTQLLRRRIYKYQQMFGEEEQSNED